MKYKVGVVGHFGGTQNFLDGQTIKTKIIFRELEKQFGEENVIKVDTYNWRKHPFRLFRSCMQLIRKSKNVILIPCTNGALIFVPLFFFLNLLFQRKLHYILVGAWLLDYFQKYGWMKFMLKRFDYIYVEPKKMQKKLSEMGFQRVYQMPNCKKLNILAENNLTQKMELPLKFCIFSRVLKEKGIEDAIDAVEYVNHKNGRVAASLDIYGQVDAKYEERFSELQKHFPNYIHYCGVIPYDRSTEVLKNYSALLFPTLYYTEGHPGTIIDAFASGLPVIASRWENYTDMIEEGDTGICYPFGQNECLKDILNELVHNPAILINMKKNCLKEAKKYTPDNTCNVLISNIE